MGAFHCPVGAIGYKSLGCIECGLCSAVTKEERIKASDIIREYIRNTRSAVDDIKIKKIAICGKGGAGKSSISALFALALNEYGYKVLLMDTDNSNAGLSRKVGIKNLPPNFMDYYTDNDASAIEITNKDPLALEDIENKFTSSIDGISVFCIGKIESAFQGCACSNGKMAKSIMNSLTPEDYEMVIADQDAGVESFGRGIEQGADTLIIIVEPSYDSIELAKQMKYMAEGLGIRRIRAIISKVSSEEEAEFIEDILSENEIRYLGSFGIDKTLSLANLRGESLRETKSFEAAKQLVKLLLDEAEMKVKR